MANMATNMILKVIEEKIIVYYLIWNTDFETKLEI